MAYKTPGVYVKEISKFPPSVATVETAIPAFIGYTEKAAGENQKDLTKIPTKITSLVEYEQYFGGGYQPETYTITVDGNNNVDSVSVKRFYMYDSLRGFFDNGGGDCYIVSVGSYADSIVYNDTSDPANPKGLKPGLDALLKYDEPTLILFPDSSGSKADGSNALSTTEFGSLQADALAQCNKLQDRFGIFDLQDGYVEGDTPIDNFREKVGTRYLKYGAAYYPWLITTYEKQFRVRDIEISGGTPLIDFSLPANPQLDPFINEYKAEAERTDLVMSTLSNVPMENYAALYAYYQSLIREVRKHPSSQPGPVTTAFQALLLLLRETVLSFNTIETSGLLGPDLTSQVENLKSDKALHDVMIDFISFEKNASLLSELSDLADENAVDSAYGAYDGNNNWLEGTSNSYSQVADIPALGSGELDLSTYSNKKNRALAAISYLNENLGLQKLLGALEDLFQTAIHNENQAEKRLVENHPFFYSVFSSIKREMSYLPPSGFIAGVYANIDETRGVWKAPANVSLNNVLAPAVKINQEEQESLNVHPTGKSINVIRSFTGKGILVWGARTLAGNSNEWRYISVRRLFIMVEESTQKATEAYVFEPNDANTWVKVRAMIRNFLTTLWRQGALAGGSPDQAFFVAVGLGETMTAQDILEGRMNVEIGLAVARPAEFIVLKFSHLMQSG
ncbi:MAG: phage tail sheath C-terminal domain-containing protein [Bacteroidales bacterium]